MRMALLVDCDGVRARSLASGVAAGFHDRIFLDPD
jgi:hypothetical protein